MRLETAIQEVRPTELPPGEQLYHCVAPPRLEVLSHGDIPKATKAAAKALYGPSWLRNVGTWGLFVAIWAAGTAVLSLEGPLLLDVVAWLAMAGCLFAWLSLMHEATHGNLLPNKLANRLLGFLCGAPALVSCSAYKSVHLLHHARTRQPDDPDDAEIAAQRLGLPPLLFYAALGTIGTYFYLPHIAIDGLRFAPTWRRRLLIVGEYAAIALVVVGVLSVLGPWGALRFWGVPMLITAQLMHLRMLSEHTLMSRGNPFTGSRTVTSNAFVSFWLCNVNYHLEHHLFPAVPWYHLPRINAMLRDEYRRSGASVYGSHREFLRDWFQVVLTEQVVPGRRLVSRETRAYLANAMPSSST